MNPWDTQNYILVWGKKKKKFHIHRLTHEEKTALWQADYKKYP